MNRLLFGGSVIAVIVFAISAAAFSVDKIWHYGKMFLWGDSIEVISFRLYEDGVVQNTGYRPLYVLYAELSIPKFGRRFRVPLNQPIAVNEFVKFEDLGGDRKVTALPFVVPEDLDAARRRDAEVLPIIAARTDPSYELTAEAMRDNPEPLQTFECDGKIIFSGGADEGKQSEGFDCVAFLATTGPINPHIRERGHQRQRVLGDN